LQIGISRLTESILKGDDKERKLSNAERLLGNKKNFSSSSHYYSNFNFELMV